LRTILLHVACFRRRPSFEEFARWRALREAGGSLRACAETILASGEFRTRYQGFTEAVIARRAWGDAVGLPPPDHPDDLAGQLLALAGSTRLRELEGDGAFVALAFFRLRGCSPDPEAFDTWTHAIAGGRPRAALVDVLLN
jgi:hypothetical protein